MAEEKEIAITKDEVIKSQGKSKSESVHETVEITIIKDSKFYKKGDTDMVHPATAEIFRLKGLIK